MAGDQRWLMRSQGRISFDNVADQDLSIVLGAGATAYHLAAGEANPDPVVIANQRVGGGASQLLAVSNTAPVGAFTERLNADFGTISGQATNNGGSVSGLDGGVGNATAMSVGVDTSTAGAKSGTVTLNYVSDGTGVSGLGVTAIGSQVIDVSGDVYRLAQGSATPDPIVFANRHVGDAADSQAIAVSGNVYRLAEATIDNPLAFAFGAPHVGDSASQVVSISNTAVADAFSEGLDASFGAASDGRILDNAGSIADLAAGATNAAGLVVSIDTSAVGTITGTQTIDFASNGASTSGLGITGLASQDLALTASIAAGVFRLANPFVNNAQPIALGNFREGDVVASSAISVTNDVPDDGFSESLNASVGGASGGVTSNGGSFNLLLPSATDDTDITVAIDTSVAGEKSGDLTLDFASDGTGTSGIVPNAAIAGQVVNVTGKVYQAAIADVVPTTIDFGKV